MPSCGHFPNPPPSSVDGTPELFRRWSGIPLDLVRDGPSRQDVDRLHRPGSMSWAVGGGESVVHTEGVLRVLKSVLKTDVDPVFRKVLLPGLTTRGTDSGGDCRQTSDTLIIVTACR